MSASDDWTADELVGFLEASLFRITVDPHSDTINVWPAGFAGPRLFDLIEQHRSAVVAWVLWREIDHAQARAAQLAARLSEFEGIAQ